MIQGSGRCHYHPERPGLGVCVECRNVVCRECTTPIDGINRCAHCLEARRARQQSLPVRREWGAFNLLLAVVGAVALYGGVMWAAWLFQP